MIGRQRRISVVLVLVLLNSCGNPQPSSPEQREEDPILLESNSTTLSSSQAEQVHDTEEFLLRIDKVSVLFSDWGFQLEEEAVFRNRGDFSRHWWLGIFDRKYRVDTSHFPSAIDWQDISEIRQFTFKKNWKYFIEEWQFSDQQAARRWFNIAVKTRRLDDQKPPRIYWLEKDKMYFIMATAAYDWFEYSSELIRAFSGREASDIHLSNEASL